MVLLNSHEQLISGIYLGKGLLVVLMFFGSGSSLQNLHVAFFFLIGGECIVHKV